MILLSLSTWPSLIPEGQDWMRKRAAGLYQKHRGTRKPAIPYSPVPHWPIRALPTGRTDSKW